MDSEEREDVTAALFDSRRETIKKQKMDALPPHLTEFEKYEALKQKGLANAKKKTIFSPRSRSMSWGRAEHEVNVEENIERVKKIPNPEKRAVTSPPVHKRKVTKDNVAVGLTLEHETRGTAKITAVTDGAIELLFRGDGERHCYQHTQWQKLHFTMSQPAAESRP